MPSDRGVMVGPTDLVTDAATDAPPSLGDGNTGELVASRAVATVVPLLRGAVLRAPTEDADTLTPPPPPPPC